MEKYESWREVLPKGSPTWRNSGTDMQMAGVRTVHSCARAGGGEVKAGHLSLTVLLDTDELPLIYHIWPQAFNGVWV